MNPIALFPQSASTFSPSVDHITFALLGVCGFMMVAIFTLILYFGIRYRKGSSADRTLRERGENILEWGWTLTPVLILMGLFAWGAETYLRMHAPPDKSIEVTVVGKQWMWYFQHADGRRELNELHVPVDRPVLLTLSSQDVIHSFYVPAFRIKQDVLPGRFTYLWFQATKPGRYHLFCAQYCGTTHAGMRGEVIVQSEADYGQWAAQRENL